VVDQESHTLKFALHQFTDLILVFANPEQFQTASLAVAACDELALHPGLLVDFSIL
jgi:hypothetical protein